MIVALFVVMGPVEMFAWAEDNESTETVEAVGTEVTETQEEAVTEEPAEPAVDAEEPASEEAVVEEPAAEEAVVEEAADESADKELMAAGTAVTLSYSDVGTNSLKLSWTVTQADGLALSLFKGDEKITDIPDPVNTTSYEVKGLDQNTAYTFKAKIGEATSEVSVTTAKAEIPNFRKVSSYRAVYLRWSKVDKATSYHVFINNKEVTDPKNGIKSTEYKHNVGTEKDVYNLYNTGKGEKVSGYIDGRDRFTYTVVAKDSSGNVVAQSTTKGDIVKTLYYKLTFKSGATLTSHSGGKVKIKVRKGAVVYARGFTNGKYIFDYQCKDGKVRTYYTMKIRVKAKLSKHITAVKKKRGTNTQPAYTEEEAEQYANDRGIKKATTKYMIWINLFSQKEYIFQKSGGKWQIMTANANGLSNKKMCALPISTGRATMPTATGSTKINRKLKSQHGTPLWNVTKYFSVHGVQKKWPKPGWPESGACARNQNPNAKWIYNQIPKYSRVFVH